MTAVLASARCPAFDSYEFLTFRLINTHDHVWNEVVFRRMGLLVPLEILNTFPKEKIFVDLSFLGMCSKRCWSSSQLKCMQLDSSGVSRRLRLPWIHICYRTTFIVGLWQYLLGRNLNVRFLIRLSSNMSLMHGPWHFLLANGQGVADKFCIKPEELMCITRAGTTQNFSIYDFAVAVQHGPRHAQSFGQHHPGFGLSPNTQFHRPPMFPHQNSLPTIMYLLTSL